VSIGKNKNFFAIFGLLFGATVWGIIWFPYRLMEQSGINGVMASFYTYLSALLIGCFVFSRHWRGMFQQPKSIIWLALAAGWTNLSYVLAVIDGEVMRVILLFYLSPIWAMILAHFWLREPIGLKEVAVIFISLIGASIMLYDASISSSLPIPSSQSDWLALSAGMGFALTNVITRKSSHLSLLSKAFAVWLGVVLLSLMCILLFSEGFRLPNHFNTTDFTIGVVVALMLFSSALFVQYGVTHVPAARAAVIFLFELVVAAIAAYFLAGESMTINEWIGGALIIFAAIYVSLTEPLI
jgi:drug/metabolite transporter (DMT)-like permease